MKKLYFALYVFLTFSLFAQQKGNLKGVITDAANNAPLPGVNIMLEGTYFGAASDVDGKYLINNIPEGTYTIKVSFIGYKKTKVTGVEVTANRTVKINVVLYETFLTLDQDVVVLGEKPLLDVEETQSKTTISKKDIEVAVVENINDIVSQQVGVTKSDNEIHIRGGRSYENAFLIDGVSVQDPLAGTGFGLNLSANSIQEAEVITGGFNAEYGQATSGIINVITREGVDKYSGYFSYKTDKTGKKSSNHIFDVDVFETNFGGPEPITSYILPALGIKIPGKLSFFTSLYAGFSDGITQGFFKQTAKQLVSSTFGGSRFAPKAENSYFLLGKLTYAINPRMKLRISFNKSVSINQNSQSLQTNLEFVEPSPGYQYLFQNILDNANTYTHQNTFTNISWTHTINSKTFYEIKLSHFFTNLRADANGKKWNEYIEPIDIVNFPIEYFNTNGDTVGVIPGDGFYDVGNPYKWYDHYVDDYSIKADITSFFDEKNKFKAGFEMKFQEMQLIDIYKPWVGELGLNNDMYKVHPAKGSFYAQDNINFSGMILNFGLRMDYWFPGKLVDDAVNNPDVITIPDEIRRRYKEETFGWFGGRRFKARLSPRLGISHPITNNQVLFFSYGHFSKWPRPQFVYAKLSPSNAQSSFQKFGNPNLNPETTVSYELGIKNSFSQNDVLTITAYYKDIFDYIRTRTAKISNARFANQSFITYANMDYARSRGLELEYKKRIGKWFTGSVNFAYAIVTGKSSSADEGVLILRGDLTESIKEEFVSWDRPVTSSLNVNFYVPKGKPLFGLAPGILDDINLYIRVFFESGRRYTPYIFTGSYGTDNRPEYIADVDNRYSKVGDNWFYIDLNFNKYFKVGGLKFSFFIEVNNLLDAKNSEILNPVTGTAYETGDPTPSSWNDPNYPDLQAPISPFPYNPARYLTRRNVKFGMSMNF